MKLQEDFPNFVDGLIYLKVHNGIVNAYGDLQSLEDAERVQKTGKLYDAVVDPDEWKAADGDARIVDGKIVLGPSIETIFNRNSEIVRYERNARLMQCDKISPMRWIAMTPEEQQAWIDYRIALLNIPQQEGFPWDGDLTKVPWPVQPE